MEFRKITIDYYVKLNHPKSTAEEMASVQTPLAILPSKLRKKGIAREVISDIFTFCRECTRMTEEEKPIGTCFIVGDEEKVLEILCDQGEVIIPEEIKIS